MAAQKPSAAESLQNRKTVLVPHLGASVGYEVSNGKLDPAKPTVVLINPICSTAEYYRAELETPRLTSVANLLAIEPLGHGATTCDTEQFTYWNSALVILQAMVELGVGKAFVLGTSQGGWIAARLALLAPGKILGLITLGTSMDAETAESRAKGGWDPSSFVGPFLQKWSKPDPKFVVGDDWIQPVLGLSFGASATPDAIDYWTASLKSVYVGDAGRKKLRTAVICLAERDGLILRLEDIKCPVHWLQGSEDPVYGSTLAKEHIHLFKGSKSAKLDVLENGAHFLNVSHPNEVQEAILAMVAEA